MVSPSEHRRRVEIHARALSNPGLRVLDRLDYCALIRDDAEQLLAAYAESARSQGFSWSEIGAAVGVSKQGAQQRWGKRGDVEPDENQPALPGT